MKRRQNLLLALYMASSLSPVFANVEESKEPVCHETEVASTCAISCSEPMENSCETVIATLKATTKACAEKNFEELAKYLDENCTTYDVCTKKTVIGKEAIIKNVREKISAEERKLKVPAISFHIDHPFAKITGDKAVVTFVLRKEVGGANPAVFESHVTDVFVKRDGQWKKLHFCGGDWKRVK